MAKLWQRTRDENDQSRLIEQNARQTRLDRPSVVFLTGAFTLDFFPEPIAGALKRLEELMDHRPGNQQPAELYAWSHTSLATMFNFAAYNIFPKRSASRAAHKLASATLMPLVADDFSVDRKWRNPKGTPLPLEQVKKNLRNVTFFGYSAGTIVGQECFNATLKMMKKIGYTEEDARAALNEVVLISAGNVSRPAYEKNRFTTLYLAASNDKIIRAKHYIWQPLKALFARYTKELTIQRLSATSAFISAAVTRQKWEWRKSKGKPPVRKKFRLMFRPLPFFRSYHELPHYITHDENLSPFARIVISALTHATGRTEKLDPLKMLEAPPGCEQAEALAYNAKIQQALLPSGVRI